MKAQITPIEFFVNRIYINSDLNEYSDFIAKYNLTKKSRQREFCILRQIFVHAVATNTRMNWTDIGKLVNQNHATIIHSVNVINTHIKNKDKIYLSVLMCHKKDLDNLEHSRKKSRYFSRDDFFIHK